MTEKALWLLYYKILWLLNVIFKALTSTGEREKEREKVGGREGGTLHELILCFSSPATRRFGGPEDWLVHKAIC